MSEGKKMIMTWNKMKKEILEEFIESFSDMTEELFPDEDFESKIKVFL
jgi:hypothetical protein